MEKLGVMAGIGLLLACSSWAAAVQQTLDPCAYVAAELKRGAKRILVPQGVYDVGPGEIASIFLRDVQDVTLDFQGGELRGKVRSGMVMLENCRNVTIRNLVIDYPFNLPFTQGVIEQVTGDGAWDVRILGGYPDPENGAWGWPVQAYDPKTGELVNPMRYLNEIRVVRTAPGRYHVSGGMNRRGKVGDIAVWSLGCETSGGARNLRPRAHAVYLLGCAGCRLENVTVYSTPGSNGFRELFGDGGNAYVGCKLVPRPPETDPVKRVLRRFRSGNHDAFNSRGARRGPTLLGCVARNHCDDDVNIHGAYQYVSSVSGCVARVFVKDLYKDSLKVGDDVQFVTADGFAPKELLRIAAIRTVAYTEAEHAAMLKGLCAQMKNACHTMQEIAFDRAHAVLRAGSLFVSQNCAGNGFLLKDCRFGPNRARGFICNASHGRVEGCVFDRLEGPAILSRPSYPWLEGGASRDITVENCTFLDCPVSITTHRTMETTSDCHRDYSFRHCVFRGTRGKLDVRCCNGLVLDGNVFELPANKAINLVKVVGKIEKEPDPTVTPFMAGDSTLHSRKEIRPAVSADDDLSAAAWGKRYWRTKAEADREAWVRALVREGHDFSKRYKARYGMRGLYKFNLKARLACFVITKPISERLGRDTFDAETAEGPFHFEWTRKPDGAVDYSYAAPTNWDVFITAYGAPKKANPRPEANISFSTSFPKRGIASLSVAHHRPDWVAGPHAEHPFPTNEIRAVDNFVFALREAFPLLGFDRPETMDGSVWLGTFDSNFPNGHTDFPAHFHIIPCCRDGKQVHHFYVRAADGRITSDCYQDMSSVIDVWDRAETFLPGTEFPCYDNRGRVAFRVKMLADGTGLELTTRARDRAVRVASPRPCDGVDVSARDGAAWKTVRRVTIKDDPFIGRLETPEGVVFYDPASGKRRTPSN